MLLAVDIGNSLIKFGLFDGAKLLDKTSSPTTPTEIDLDRFKKSQIHIVAVASVVPELTDVVRKTSQTALGVTPAFIDHSTDFGLKINYDPPESVGIDRLINASHAANKYGTPVIVCSFGTATVIDVVSQNREFLGGIIAPGVKTMSEALRQTTAQLPPVEIEEPHSLIGNSTEAAISSGIVNGHVAMAEGLIERIIGTRTPPSAMSATHETSSAASGVADGGVRVPKVIATGGFANLIASKIEAVDEIDENLTLHGLRMLAERL